MPFQTISPLNVEQALQAVIRKRHGGNRRCAECTAKRPTWASINLGIFVCWRCSGQHRRLGTHLSKVKSTTLDRWLPRWVAVAQAVGNHRSNKFWEATLPRGSKPTPATSADEVLEFIRQKYVPVCDVMKHCHTFHVTHVATAGTPCTLGQLPDRRQPPACEHQRAALWMCQLRSLLLDRRSYPHPTRLLFRHTLQPCWRVVAWASAVVPPLPGPAWWNVVTLAPTWWFPVLRNSPRRMWRPRRLCTHRHRPYTRQYTHSHQRHRWPSLLTRSEQRHHSRRVGRL